MSTRSRIGLKLENGQVISIYCHFDGYPDGVGKTLRNCYVDRKRVEELISLGDISCLAERLAPERWEVHSYDSPKRDITLAYGRDRGETDVAPHTHQNVNEYLSNSLDYMYIFDEGQWHVYKDRKLLW